MHPGLLTVARELWNKNGNELRVANLQTSQGGTSSNQAITESESVKILTSRLCAYESTTMMTCIMSNGCYKLSKRLRTRYKRCPITVPFWNLNKKAERVPSMFPARCSVRILASRLCNATIIEQKRFVTNCTGPTEHHRDNSAFAIIPYLLVERRAP